MRDFATSMAIGLLLMVGEINQCRATALERPINATKSGQLYSRAIEGSASERPTCTANGQPNTCYHNGSKCYLVVLVCYSCCFGDQGYSKGEQGRPCGVCIGWDF